MDVTKRRELLAAFDRALAGNGPITLSCAGDKLVTLRADFTCYENHIEGTDEQGAPVSMPYAAIERIHSRGI